MKNGCTLVELATELTRQLETKRDLLVPSPMLHFSTDDGGSSLVVIDQVQGPRTYGITELARRQLAEKLKIPYAYFERMRAEQPALLDRNVNTWLTANPERRLVRTLDGHVRAVLSDKYRRLDNFDLAEHVLPILQRLEDARFASVELTDTKLYLKIVTPRVQREVAPGDFVQAGVVVTNSEVGEGTLSVSPLVYRLICRNGAIAADRSMKKTHVGRSLEADDTHVLTFKDDTLRADDTAFFLKVRDVVEEAVSEASLTTISEKMQRTMGIRLQGDPVKSVEVLADRFYLNEVERNGVLRHLIEGGDLSGYGLINAVTGFSQDVESYDRATELEVFGGRLIEMPDQDWEAVAKAQ